MSEVGQPLPSHDFCGTAAFTPETGHRSGRLARQKGAQTRTSCSAASSVLFDQLVGAGEECWRHF